MRIIFKALILFYQRYISRYTPPSCRYYPTCSQYALSQFENNSIFKAIYFTIARVFKCNKFFDGGFDYPLIKIEIPNNISYKKIKVKYWLIPAKDKKYFVIKNWRKKEE